LSDEDHVEAAIALFEAQSRSEVLLVAPFTLYYELPAALLKAVRTRRITNDDARIALDLFFRLPLRIAGGNRKTAADISHAAYDLASSLGCSYYDATFLGLARTLGTHVVTAEDKAYRTFSGRTPLLLWIGDAL
jgi:predicted nucleic acid-binding protein